MHVAPREFPRGVASLAAVVALALVAALFTPMVLAHYRAWTHFRRPAPAVIAKPSLTATVIEATNCRLPVVAIRESGPPTQMDSQAGFVDTKTGAFTKDTSASVAGLPGGGSAGSSLKAAQPSVPQQYSPGVKRWLPRWGPYVAPDGRSYAWEQLLPEGSNSTTATGGELHIYDLAAAQDRVLWSYSGSINVYRWDADGILAMTVPPRGGVPTYWLIDASSGIAAQQPSSADPRRLIVLLGDASATGDVGYGHSTPRQGRETCSRTRPVSNRQPRGRRPRVDLLRVCARDARDHLPGHAG